MLEKILASGYFGEDGPLLRSVVESGNPATLDEATLSRLRTRLAEYYAGPGKDHAVVIQIPEGPSAPMLRGYQPSPGRKLIMFGLCLIGLIAVWIWFFFANR